MAPDAMMVTSGHVRRLLENRRRAARFCDATLLRFSRVSHDELRGFSRWQLKRGMYSLLTYYLRFTRDVHRFCQEAELLPVVWEGPGADERNSHGLDAYWFGGNEPIEPLDPLESTRESGFAVDDVERTKRAWR